MRPFVQQGPLIDSKFASETLVGDHSSGVTPPLSEYGRDRESSELSMIFLLHKDFAISAGRLFTDSLAIQSALRS